MSKEHDDRTVIKLDPNNEKALRKAHKDMGEEFSFTAFVNWFIRKALEADQSK